MPTREHDVLAELFRWSPLLAADLVGGLGVDLPEVKQAVDASESFTDLKTSEYTADAVVMLEGSDTEFGVVVEVQKTKDPDKRWTWPLYLHTLRVRKRCPVALLVIAPDEKVARWCAEPVASGHPDHTFAPLVLKPEHVPVMTDPEEIRADPALGVLSAMFHSTGTRSEPVLQAVLDGADAIGLANTEQARRYYEFVTAVIPEAACKSLEKLMMTDTFKPRSDLFELLVAKGEKQGEARGEVRGEAKSILKLLEMRGIEVPDAVRERVISTVDVDQLDVWLGRAVTVNTAEELFT